MDTSKARDAVSGATLTILIDTLMVTERNSLYSEFAHFYITLIIVILCMFQLLINQWE